MKNVKITLASAKFINENTEYNLNKIFEFTGLAKAEGTDLVCFGEAFLQGFNLLYWNYDTDSLIAK